MPDFHTPDKFARFNISELRQLRYALATRMRIHRTEQNDQLLDVVESLHDKCVEELEKQQKETE